MAESIWASLLVRLSSVGFVLTVLCGTACAQLAPQRWPEDMATEWYARQPWLVGANFVPSDATNQLEMFQKATFNPNLIDKELGMAEDIGMNTMRVFLQDQLYLSDPDGFKMRLDQFLAVAAKHHIRPVLVLFDSCWEPDPKLGPQHPPIPGVHNSGWVQSPGWSRLSRSSRNMCKALWVLSRRMVEC